VKLFWPGRCCDFPHAGQGWVWRIGLHVGEWRYGLALRPSDRYVRYDGGISWVQRVKR
jgi:hypothetical protein